MFLVNHSREILSVIAIVGYLLSGYVMIFNMKIGFVLFIDTCFIFGIFSILISNYGDEIEDK